MESSNIAAEDRFFNEMYSGVPPWDTGWPQREFIRLEDDGEIRGTVLDAGCGTGELSLFLVSHGHGVTGIDSAPAAIVKARAKAAKRGLGASFLVRDALELQAMRRRFDTVLDCGLFHVFSDEERPAYARSLASVLRPGGACHILCFSEREPVGWGPRRVTQDELRETFCGQWRMERIREGRFETNLDTGEAQAWLATARRV